MEGETNSGSAVAGAPAAAPTSDATTEFDPSLSEEERRFYLKAYPNVDLVRERKVHCTICKIHIGTAVSHESTIKMHPILRVTHCTKCHDFYNSGEFSKGEDGSELYCRWCGQGGEVYCCSNCPFVFCKSCIVKNLSRGVVADIEQNENWNCFSCAPKILWPLRAQHWALINYIEKQKKSIQAMNINEYEKKALLAQDRTTCCRLAKSKCGNMSDSMESLESTASRRSLGSGGSAKKPPKLLQSPAGMPAAKRQKTSNDEVVCTPDLLSMLEPDCQITVSSKPRPMQPSSGGTPKVISIQSGYNSMSSTPKSNNTPPPLVLRNTGMPIRHQNPLPVVRRTIIGPRTPATINSGSNTPVYHTINGFRIDLNSAAQQETFRLPNGKLIQVKRQGAIQNQNPTGGPNNNSWTQQHQQQQQQQQQQHQRSAPIQHLGNRPIQITPATPQTQHYITVQPNSNSAGNTSHQIAQQHPQMVRYHNTTVTPVSHNGGQIQLINGAPPAPAINVSAAARAPLMVRHLFPDTAIGQARSQLQDQVFNAMEICQHLSGKVQTLTNSNAYKQARNYLEVKELYIHLSYLLTYAIGRFKGLQDKCLGDMRQLGFVNDADSLENGQLAAGVDYVRYGQLDDVDLFNTGSNSFHNQVYEYRKSLYANMKQNDGEEKRPLSPLMPLGQQNCDDEDDDDEADEQGKEDYDASYNDTQDVDENDEQEESYFDDDQQDEGEMEGDGDDDEPEADIDTDFKNCSTDRVTQARHNSAHRGTEDYMSREERSHGHDRKLTRLIQQYPSIWCTRHSDYGNFEVTRKQWRIIASHFKRSENIKLRWKNIRKRFVRIERRISEGKRFNGYFDKATNYLANRDLPESQWIQVDCGAGDGDVYERKQLDAIEQKLYPSERKESRQRYLNQQQEPWCNDDDDSINANGNDYKQQNSDPLEICAMDLKIINFVKCNPTLWRKSPDFSCSKIDEQASRSLWMHLWKSMPSLKCDDIMDRWSHLYEMYKAFRLKTIKDEQKLANLELKYSKYLAKLSFLYKIDEEELRNENLQLLDCDGFDEYLNSDSRLQDMVDDQEFMIKLVHAIQRYPTLWNTRDADYYDTVLRENLWHDIATELQDFKRDVQTIKLRWQLAKFSYSRYWRERRHLPKDEPLPKYYKQASDDEDNEIEIVEPKTDTITLDSDNDDDPSTNASSFTVELRKSIGSSKVYSTADAVSSTMPQLKLNKGNTTNFSINGNNEAENGEDLDFMTTAQSLLASLLEVDMNEGESTTRQAISPNDSSDSNLQKKQPRKKTTNKPNPTLIKQKEMLERERLEEIKRNDLKLKMKCTVELKKAEEEFPFAKEMLEEQLNASVNNGEYANDDNMDGLGEKCKSSDNNSNASIDEQVEILDLVDMDSSIEEVKSVEKKETDNARTTTKNENFIVEIIQDDVGKSESTDDNNKDADKEIIIELVQNSTSNIVDEKETTQKIVISTASIENIENEVEKIKTAHSDKQEDNIENIKNFEVTTIDKERTEMEKTASAVASKDIEIASHTSNVDLLDNPKQMNESNKIMIRQPNSEQTTETIIAEGNRIKVVTKATGSEANKFSDEESLQKDSSTEDSSNTAIINPSRVEISSKTNEQRNTNDPKEETENDLAVVAEDANETVPADDGDIDVDKEIDKLLQRQCETSASSDILDTNNEHKESKTTVSPDLLTEINELLENENDLVT